MDDQGPDTRSLMIKLGLAGLATLVVVVLVLVVASQCIAH